MDFLILVLRQESHVSVAPPQKMPMTFAKAHLLPDNAGYTS
jgi:hypothetical protein